MSEMADAIRELTQEKGFSMDSVKQTIENTLKAAYKRTFGTADNCIITFADDMSDVTVASRKTIVDGVYDPLTEIELEDALKLSSECELGDEIDIIVDPKSFDRSAVSVGKQETHKGLNESAKAQLINENKDKVGQIIVGYYQREYKGSIYVDLGRVEGVLPVKYQSPREKFEKDDRIKAYVMDIKSNSNGVQLILSRSDPNFVRGLIEVEVPEIQDKTIEIKKIVRDAGYRTKLAVATNKEDVDPVGACVGLKGTRIQTVIRELDGEKIDVLRYDEDPCVFIKNALSPAEVLKVVITDEEKKQALAIVDDSQFSLAIGKQGQNVRLANRLCDWSIDVKTEEQAAELDLSEFSSRKTAESLFSNNTEEVASSISDLEGVDENVVTALKNAGYEDIEKFITDYDDGKIADIDGVTNEDLEKISKLIKDTVDFVEEESDKTPSESAENASEEAGEDEYFCPECGARITLDMTHCPKCGVEFEFEEDEE